MSNSRRARSKAGPANPALTGGFQAGQLPWWLPAVLYVGATVVLFAEFIFSDAMLYGGDTIQAGGYMARAYLAERLAAGDFPLWGTRQYGGIPFFESLSGGDAIYPTSLLYLVSEPYRAVGWKLVLHVLAGGFFMHGWVRSLGLDRRAATVAGLAWLLAPAIVTLVLPGNDGKLMVASLAPLVFWGAESVMRRPSARSGAGLAGAVALTCLTTQFQTSYFLFGSVGAYAVFRTVQKWRKGATGARRFYPATIFLGSALLGGGLAAFQLLPAASYVGDASRRTATTVDASPEAARAYSSSWSLHPEEAVALVVPEFVGNSAADAAWAESTYWGRNAVKLNHEYVGVTVLTLALFGLAGAWARTGKGSRKGRPRGSRNRQGASGAGAGAERGGRHGMGGSSSGASAGLRWFMAGMALVWLFFALGAHTPVWRLFYEFVPGISLFRAPSLAAFLVSFGATTLLAVGVDDLVRAKPSPGAFLTSVRGRVLLGAVALLLLGLILQSTGALERFWTTVVHPGAGADAQASAALARLEPFATRGFGIALVLAGLVATILWAVMEGKVSATVAVVVAAGLIALDLGRIDRAFIRNFDFHAWAAPDANTRFLADQKERAPPFRVADLRGSIQNVEYAMHGQDLVGGHHPNDLARYRQLLGLAGSEVSGANTNHPNVLRMLNVKYVVWPLGRAGRPPWEGAQALSTTAGGGEAVYAYPGLEKAWVVGSATVVDDDEAALARVLSRDFDPAREAVASRPAPEFFGALAAPSGEEVAEAAGAVVWETAEADYRRIRVTNHSPGLLIVSENWFPGWVAEVDGAPAEVHRVNVTLQAIALPTAGEHVVELRYTAPTVARALRVSVASALAVGLMLATPLLARFLGRRPKTLKVPQTGDSK